jgi:uncharacterized membrane protein
LTGVFGLELFGANRQWGYLLLLGGLMAFVALVIASKVGAPPFVYGIVYAFLAGIFSFTILSPAFAAIILVTIIPVLVGTAKASQHRQAE